MFIPGVYSLLRLYCDHSIHSLHSEFCPLCAAVFVNANGLQPLIMQSSILLISCAPQSSGRIHPHAHLALARRVSPSHYTLHFLLSSRGTLSASTLSSDELAQSVRPSSGCIVGSVPASEASALERHLQSLTILPTPPLPTPPSSPGGTPRTSLDEECQCYSRWLDILRSLRDMTCDDNTHFIIRDEEETRNEMKRRREEWASSAQADPSFVDWLASLPIDTMDIDSST